ncbi:MAG: rod shape-determining protein MreD [Deltaproteobacteria bacterium]|nr:rod shape-determining protein MreD [Deltaproteobacteria bacterium]
MLTFAFVAVVGVVLQATIIHSLFPSAIGPDLLLTLVLYLALQSYNPFGLFVAFLLGVFGDFASGLFVGPNAAGFILAFHLAAFMSRKIYADHPVIVALIAFCASIVKFAGFAITLSLSAGINVTSGALMTVLWEALSTAICAPIVMSILRHHAKSGVASARKTHLSAAYMAKAR